MYNFSLMVFAQIKDHFAMKIMIIRLVLTRLSVPRPCLLSLISLAGTQLKVVSTRVLPFTFIFILTCHSHNHRYLDYSTT